MLPRGLMFTTSPLAMAALVRVPLQEHRPNPSLMASNWLNLKDVNNKIIYIG